MKFCIRLIDRISALIGALAGLMLCAGLVMICAEIVLRSLFDRTLYITDEYMGYLMCGLTFCALAYTLREKGHIRMTLLFRLFSVRMRQQLNLLCYFAGLLFSAYLTYVCASFFWDSVATRSQSIQISATYLAIPQFAMPLGAFMLAMQFVAELLRGILILRGDTTGILVLAESDDAGR